MLWALVTWFVVAAAFHVYLFLFPLLVAIVLVVFGDVLAVRYEGLTINRFGIN